MLWINREPEPSLADPGPPEIAIDDIWRETAKARWSLMGAMHEQRGHMYGRLGPGAFDEAAARQAFEAMQATRNAMFDLSLEARRRIDAVLTPAQREKLRR